MRTCYLVSSYIGSYCLSATSGPSISSGLCLHEARVKSQPKHQTYQTTELQTGICSRHFDAFGRYVPPWWRCLASFFMAESESVDTLQTPLKKNRLACNGRWKLIVLSIKEIWSQWTKLWVLYESCGHQIHRFMEFQALHSHGRLRSPSSPQLMSYSTGGDHGLGMVPNHLQKLQLLVRLQACVQIHIICFLCVCVCACCCVCLWFYDILCLCVMYVLAGNVAVRGGNWKKNVKPNHIHHR